MRGSKEENTKRHRADNVHDEEAQKQKQKKGRHKKRRKRRRKNTKNKNERSYYDYSYNTPHSLHRRPAVRPETVGSCLPYTFSMQI